MSRFIALLRGVNVGRGRRVPMAAFKALLEGLGCTGVDTVLNSGNAVFSSRARSATRLAASIADALRAQLAVDTLVIVKTAEALDDIVRANPFPPPAAEQSRFMVVLAPDGAALAALAPLHSLAAPPERWALTPQAAYLHCAAGVLDSALARQLLGPAGQRVTTRNWATVLKLQALAGDGATQPAPPRPA